MLIPRTPEPKNLPHPGVFVDGFLDSQLVSILPLIHGFCEERGITHLIFRRNLSAKLLNHSESREVLEKFKVHTFEDPYSSNAGRILKALMFLPRAISLALASSRRGLLTHKKDWHQIHRRHALRDTAQISSPEGKIALPTRSRLAAAFGVLLAEEYGKRLLSKHRISSAFMGHSVYTDRALLALMQKRHIEVFSHYAGIVHRTPSPLDPEGRIFSAEQLRAESHQAEEKFKEYWNSRRRGSEGSLESQLASRALTKVELATPRNIVFLHVFRDSPFYTIDRSRIFPDYVIWFLRTLLILRDSSEEWLIRPHPSSLRWGEDPFTWIKSVGHRAFGMKGWPDNLLVSSRQHSNLDLLRHGSRIVTYNGSVHLESACWGIRPIVITNTMLGTLDSSLVLKPESLAHYRELLLRCQDDELFTLNPEQVASAQKLLWFSDNALSFQRDVGSFDVFRNDSPARFNQEFDSVARKAPFFSPRMRLEGRLLALGSQHTRSLSNSKSPEV